MLQQIKEITRTLRTLLYAHKILCTNSHSSKLSSVLAKRRGNVLLAQSKKHSKHSQRQGRNILTNTIYIFVFP